MMFLKLLLTTALFVASSAASSRHLQHQRAGSQLKHIVGLPRRILAPLRQQLELSTRTKTDGSEAAAAAGSHYSGKKRLAQDNDNYLMMAFKKKALLVRGGGGLEAAPVAGKVFVVLHLLAGLSNCLIPGTIASGYKLNGESPLVRILIQSQGEFALACGILGYSLLMTNVSTEKSVGYALLSPLVMTTYFILKKSVGDVGFNKAALSAQACLLAAASYSVLTEQAYGKTLVTVLMSYLWINSAVGVVNPVLWGRTWGLEKDIAAKEDITFLHVLLAFTSMTFSSMVLLLFQTDIDPLKAIGVGALIEVVMNLVHLFVRKDIQKLGMDPGQTYGWLLVIAVVSGTIILSPVAEKVMI